MDASSKMLDFLRLFYRFIVRDLRRDRVRAALTISGIAAGIAVVVAVQLANARAIRSFDESLHALSGQSDLQITANGLPLREDIMRQLDWVWDYGSMSPVVEGRGVLPELNGEGVQVFGVDLLSEAAIRRYILTDRTELTQQISRDEFINLHLDPHQAIVTPALAKLLALQ